jgi:hypothetical protein
MNDQLSSRSDSWMIGQRCDLVTPPRRDTMDLVRSFEIGAARRTLEEARCRLDSALAGMPEIDGDEAMATPKLLMLLVGAVDAKKRLDALLALPDRADGRPARV